MILPGDAAVLGPVDVRISRIAGFAVNILDHGIGSGPGAGLKLNFTNSPGAAGQFTVWGSINLVPAAWHSLGHPTEAAAGVYQFIDSAATNRTQQFYKVASP